MCMMISRAVFCISCLDGVTGDNCSECELDNHFLQSGVCQPCQCSDDGSVSLQCNDTGECMCVVRQLSCDVV